MEDGENGPKRLYNDHSGKNTSKNNEKYQNIAKTAQNKSFLENSSINPGQTNLIKPILTEFGSKTLVFDRF